VVGDESPLRRLPLDLDRKQALYLDGMRHAVEIADLAFRRLCGTLAHIATHGHANETTTHAFADAWTLVDAVDRFRNLFQQFPAMLDRCGPPTRAEVDLSAHFAELRNLRNVADHIAQRIDYVLARRMPVLGALSWFAPDPDMEGGRIFVLAPGTHTGDSKIGAVNPAGREGALLCGIGLVTLSAGEYRVCLSEVHDLLELEVRRIESMLGSQTAGFDHGPSDALVVISGKWSQPGGAGETDSRPRDLPAQ
jgi:hypothetical protein